MSLAVPGSFLLTVCQVGAERALKAEVGRLAPDLRPAFGRPGLVTFKATAGEVGPGYELQSIFARAFAAALGPAADVAGALALAGAARAGGRLVLHVFERDVARPGEEPSGHVEGAAAVRAELLAAGADLLLQTERPPAGGHVLDVVVAPGEPLFVGHHRHSTLHSPFPCGRIPVVVPAEAPSRAFRKLEEALAWSGAPLRRGDVAVEIGSAPGGASHALLRRGLEVWGVDPGAMAEVVLASPRFHHVRLPVGEVGREQLPPRADWVLLDVNLAPQVALHAVRGVVAALRPSLRGALFTLKLNDWAMAAQLPDLLRRIEGMGLVGVRATQLPSNRQEVFAFASGPRGDRSDKRTSRG